MKLRNKKTGEVIDLGKGLIMDGMGGREIILKATCTTYGEIFRYRSLAKLNEEWEDCEPVPKISDAEWRCIVRKWYKLNHLRGLIRVKLEGKNYSIIGWREGEDFDGQVIDIPLNVLDESIVKTDKHTIDELCGEEEE